MNPAENHIIQQAGFASTAGWLFIIGLGAHLVLQLVEQVRKMRWESEQERLERDRLRSEIKAAKVEYIEAQKNDTAWNGFRKFKVANKQYECNGVYSFYLVPHDGRPLPPFKPGQYLTFQLNIPGREKPVVRCYSLSDSPFHTNYYRVTIKREEPPKDRPELPPGLASSYFVDKVKQGDILDVKAPSGHFFLDLHQPKPIVLISGGVGITPMLSMMNAIIESGTKREVWFFYGSRNRSEHIHRSYLTELSGLHDNIHIHTCYSQPSPDDVHGRDFHHKGRVTVELLKQLLPSNNYEYFLCGNGAFMKSITDGLEAWGVPENSVHFEAFGPASVKKKTALPAGVMVMTGPQPQITFSKSGQTVSWDPSLLNLLDFARDKGVRLESGCCAGSCGSCLVAIQSGQVDYIKPPDTQPEQGSCLACICRPKGDLVLDA
jgi:ferredoxin-NADP reductase